MIYSHNNWYIKQGQGIAIAIYNKTFEGETKVLYVRLLGNRKAKSKILIRQNFNDLNPKLLQNTDSSYFMPTGSKFQEEYEKFISIIDVFPKYINGIVTSRDRFSIDLSRGVLEQRLRDFVNFRKADLLKKYSGLDLKDNTAVKIETARENLRQKPKELTSCIIQCSYRPFDNRFIAYDRNILHRTREEVMGHLRWPNLGIVFNRNIRGDSPKHFFVACHPVLKEMISSKDNCYVAPLYLYPGKDTFHRNENRHANVGILFIKALSENLKLEWIRDCQRTLAKTFGPEDIFHYVYAIFFSPEYRGRYAEFLNKDFPRIPAISSKDLFRELCHLGGELVALHLMEFEKLNKPITTFPVSGDNAVTQVGEKGKTLADVKNGKGKLYINKSQYFDNLPEEVWNFYIGGYQVCHKWLADRKKAGRKLSADDIDHYHKIVVVLSETIKIMKQIDETIDTHGGWPDAFTAGK